MNIVKFLRVYYYFPLIYDLNYLTSCVNMHLGSVWSAQKTLYEALVKLFLHSFIAFSDCAVLFGVNIIIKKDTFWKNMLNLCKIGLVLLYVRKLSFSCCFLNIFDKFRVFLCYSRFSFCEQALSCDIIFLWRNHFKPSEMVVYLEWLTSQIMQYLLMACWIFGTAKEKRVSVIQLC